MAPRGALEVGLDETNVPCETPLNKEAETSQFTPPRNRRARFIVIEGGERIISALRPGRNLCGWSTYATIPTQEPSQRYPTEARLEDEAGMLIAAYSDYAESGSPSTLELPWRFVREGKSRRVPSDGGNLLVNPMVRIVDGGISATSTDGSEVELRSKLGSFGIRAESILDDGRLPAFEGHSDGYHFAAVRLGLPGGLASGVVAEHPNVLVDSAECRDADVGTSSRLVEMNVANPTPEHVALLQHVSKCWRAVGSDVCGGPLSVVVEIGATGDVSAAHLVSPRPLPEAFEACVLASSRPARFSEPALFSTTLAIPLILD